MFHARALEETGRGVWGPLYAGASTQQVHPHTSHLQNQSKENAPALKTLPLARTKKIPQYSTRILHILHLLCSYERGITLARFWNFCLDRSRLFTHDRHFANPGKVQCELKADILSPIAKASSDFHSREFIDFVARQ